MHLACSDSGVFSPLTSKGHQVDISAYPVGALAVLYSLNQLSSNETQMTPTPGKQLDYVQFGGRVRLL